jgi:zinc finger protein
MTETEEGVRLGRDEIMVFQEPCPNCSKFGEARNAMTNIPHFKEVLIMSFNCLFCGYRTNEVRGGGAIPAKGMQITVTVGCEDDMKRDVLKGYSAMLQIPEMDLELSHGSLGGVYTTVEGLINKVYTNLRDNNPFAVGDSISKHHSEDEATSKREFVTYLSNLKELCDGKRFPWTLILRDPLANSFVSAPIGSFLPPEADTPLQITEYERTSDEDDEFGIADMNTRDFETLGDMESNREAYYNPESILPDRLTHIMPKGPDHPRAFAQGVRDSTPGGVVFTRIHEDLNGGGGKSGSQGFLDGKQKQEEEDQGEPEYCTPPAGYSAARIGIGGLGGIEDYPEALKMDISALKSSGLTAINAQVSQQAVGEVDGSWDGQVGDDYGKRHFDDDSALADRFEAREEFAGRREGFVYRLGSLGLGYYPDARKLA